MIPSSIESSVQLLTSGGFHFGMFFDGDGDRMDFLSPEGQQLSPSFNFSLIVPRIREAYVQAFPSQAYAPQVFVDLKANPLAIARIAQQGLGVHVIRNGHSQIKESLRRHWPAQFLAAVEESSHYYLNILRDGHVFPSENTLFYGLLTAKDWWLHPAKYSEVLDQQATPFREREWGYKFPDDEARSQALQEIEQAFLSKGAKSMDRTSDGMDMDATLIRRGLPFVIDATTRLSEDWIQISQRISQSEKGLAWWEVSAGAPEGKDEAVALIEKMARRFGAGERYVG